MPWVVGKIQGVSLPFGPYTATQLGVLLGGGWILVQTFRFWSRTLCRPSARLSQSCHASSTALLALRAASAPALLLA
jgi:hypothetical protein